jgi:hypothetical protein
MMRLIKTIHKGMICDDDDEVMKSEQFATYAGCNIIRRFELTSILFHLQSNTPVSLKQVNQLTIDLVCEVLRSYCHYLTLSVC